MVTKYFLLKHITQILAITYAAIELFCFTQSNVKHFLAIRHSMFCTYFEKIQNRITQFLIKLILIVYYICDNNSLIV